MEVALVSKRGMLCAETVLVDDQDTPEARLKIEYTFCTGGPDDPIPGTWRIFSAGKKTVTVFVHSDKETMYEKGEEIGLDGPALREFTYALYEVKIDIEVDTKTGKTVIVAVDDRKVEDAKTDTPVNV